MGAQTGYGTLARAFRVPDAPRLVARTMHRSTMVLSELWGAANHGMTASVPYEDAYLVQLRLRDCPRCEYFCDGRHVDLADHGAGAIQLHDLRRAPAVELLDPFHVMHFLLPHSILRAVAEEAGVRTSCELSLHAGDCIRDEALTGLFLSVRPALAHAVEASTLFVDHVALAMGAHVAQAYGGVRNPRRPPKGGLAPWQERRAKELLDAHLNGDIALQVLAAECSLSVRHFTRAFRQSTGVPPHRYLLKRRVERARQLLMNPALSLLDVALACGFADQSHFTRVFTASSSLSPGLWRRMHLAREG